MPRASLFQRAVAVVAHPLGYTIDRPAIHPRGMIDSSPHPNTALLAPPRRERPGNSDKRDTGPNHPDRRTQKEEISDPRKYQSASQALCRVLHGLLACPLTTATICGIQGRYWQPSLLPRFQIIMGHHPSRGPPRSEVISLGHVRVALGFRGRCSLRRVCPR